MHRSLVRLSAAFILILFVMSALTTRAQEPVVQSEDFSVPGSNAFFPLLKLPPPLSSPSNPIYPIHVHHKFSGQRNKIPVLLVHGTWGNAQTWDFPGRSVMDNLAVQGYDVYALDLRGRVNPCRPAHPWTFKTSTSPDA